MGERQSGHDQEEDDVVNCAECGEVCYAQWDGCMYCESPLQTQREDQREDIGEGKTIAEYLFSEEFKRDFFEEPDDWEYESIRPLWSNYMFWTFTGFAIGIPLLMVALMLSVAFPGLGRAVGLAGGLIAAAGFGTWFILIPYRGLKHARLWWEERNGNGGDA